jgi:site-specific DNA-methyltransferase (adenine-specific)
LAFGGSRTFHRIAVAIEDAGFEIRDTLSWLYGSGFPKSHNLHGEWQGWGTALKPAWEPIIMARKPITGTVAQNVQEHGTGAINVDSCRIDGEPWKAHDATGLAKVKFFTNGETPVIHKEPHHRGRWPANVIIDEDAAALLDEMSGERMHGAGKARVAKRECDATGMFGLAGDGQRYGDTGGASRFFYVAKASRSERNAGLDGLCKRESRPIGISNWAGQTNGSGEVMAPSLPQSNHHPTVKPVALMRWLVQMVTPPEGIVLDPFAGSGTTGVAAAYLGFPCILIEQDEEYCQIAASRIDHALRQREDEQNRVGTLPMPLDLVAD